MAQDLRSHADFRGPIRIGSADQDSAHSMADPMRGGKYLMSMKLNLSVGQLSGR